MMLERTLQPASILGQFMPVEARVRVEQLGIDDLARDLAADVAVDQVALHTLLHRSALILEVMAVIACLSEAMEGGHEDSLDHARRLCGLDAQAVLEETIGVFGQSITQPVSSEINAKLPDLVRIARAVLEASPIEALERVAGQLDSPFGHRCRKAFEVVRAFLLRQDVSEQQRLRLVGLSYARGTLSVHQAAVLLETDPGDVLWLFERHGFHRSLETIELNDEEREQRLARIRAERLNRKGEVHFDESLISRDVLASERLEGIDARPWIQR